MVAADVTAATGEHPPTALPRQPIVIPRPHATVALPRTEQSAGESGTSVYDPGEGTGTSVFDALPEPASTELAPVAPPPPPARAAVAPAAPGWFSDPWSEGRPGLMRYWDGTNWTGYSAMAPGSLPAVARDPRRLGVPGWLLALWWFLVMLVGAGVFVIVLLMGAFACDSGWEGCSQASANAIVAYVGVTLAVATIPPIMSVIIGRGRSVGRGLRVTALVLMPLAPLIGFLTAIGWLGSQFPN